MSRPRLVIGNKNYSSWSFRAWLALAKLGIDFEEIRVALFVDGYKQRLLQYSPAGKVPVYLDGDIVVWESLAILEHLAQVHPALLPERMQARALARSVSAEMHAGFSALRNAMPMNCRATGRRVAISDAAAADITRIQAIWGDCRAAAAGGGPWLFGSFTIADAMYAPVVSRFHTYGVASHGAAAEYVKTVLNDPCVRQWYEAGRQETEVIEDDEAGTT
jgi:glutathione S-transferase